MKTRDVKGISASKMMDNNLKTLGIAEEESLRVMKAIDAENTRYFELTCCPQVAVFLRHVFP